VSQVYSQFGQLANFAPHLQNRQRMVRSRQKKLDERWGAETSAKGTRFKLNRDMVGYYNSNRAEITIKDLEPPIKITIPSPPKMRTVGDLIHFDAVEFRYPKAKKPLLEGVTFTVDQGGRCAFVGANGQGKSTLAKLILGTLSPTKGQWWRVALSFNGHVLALIIIFLQGTITRHPLLKIGYFSQHSVEDLSLPIAHLSLTAGSTPTTALSHFLEHFEAKGDKITEQEARPCLASFGLQGRVASDTPLAALSGGQKVPLEIYTVFKFRISHSWRFLRRCDSLSR
jgi:ATP-binding cassette subfamily F protein 3